MPRTDPRMTIITEAIERLIPGATPAFLSVQVTEQAPAGPAGGAHTWTGSPAAVAERVFTALYGRPAADAPPSPLAQAEAAKRARDIGAEITALHQADAALTGAHWHPLRPGDLVHVHYEQAGDFPAFGETYLVGDAGEGLMTLDLLAHTCPLMDDELRGSIGCFTAEASDDPLYELWFEAGPHRLTIVRDGQVVHLGGTR